MAPEMQSRQKVCWILSDVYIFGSTIANIFFGIKIKVLEVLLGLQFTHDIEIGIRKILVKCLKEDPFQRYLNMQEIKEQLLKLRN